MRGAKENYRLFTAYDRLLAGIIEVARSLRAADGGTGYSWMAIASRMLAAPACRRKGRIVNTDRRLTLPP